MPEPKKQSSPRKTGLRRSHLRLKLARAVNRTSPVKAISKSKLLNPPRPPRSKPKEQQRSPNLLSKLQPQKSLKNLNKREGIWLAIGT